MVADLPVKRISVSLVVDWHKVHHEHVLRSRLQAVEPRLERGEHPPAHAPDTTGNVSGNMKEPRRIERKQLINSGTGSKNKDCVYMDTFTVTIITVLLVFKFVPLFSNLDEREEFIDWTNGFLLFYLLEKVLLEGFISVILKSVIFAGVLLMGTLPRGLKFKELKWTFLWEFRLINLFL